MIYMDTTTIRVTVETRDRLNDLARRRGEPAGDVVAALVRDADEKALLASAAEDWARLGTDPDAMAAYRTETAALASFDTELPEY